MRYGLTFLLTFAVSVFFVPSHNPIVKPRNTDEEMITTSITEFWRLAQQADDYSTWSIVGDPPADYYRTFNLCEAKGHFAPSVGAGNPDSISNPEVPRVLDPVDQRYMHASVGVFARSLRASPGSSRFQIIDIRRSGAHAAVRLQYQREGGIAENVFFLMTSSAGVWKIFMIDRGWYLSFDNKYFAQAECIETPLTDLPWKAGM